MHSVDLGWAGSHELGNRKMHGHVLFSKNTYCGGGVQKADGLTYPELWLSIRIMEEKEGIQLCLK